MTDQQKIYDWCDRREADTRCPHGLIVYRATMFETQWIAGVRKWERKDLKTDGVWIRVDKYLDRNSDTQEDAIAKLAMALGL